MDLDELMYVKEGTLVDYLNTVPQNSASAIFISYFSYPDWDRTRTELNPRHYNVTYLRQFQMESVVRYVKCPYTLLQYEERHSESNTIFDSQL